MKKITTLVLAMVFVLGISTQAMAAFTNGDLIQVIYKTGQTSGTESATDLGNLATLMGAATPAGYDLNNGGIFTTANGFTNLPTLNGSTSYQVAYFAVTPSATNSNQPSLASGSTTLGQNYLLTNFQAFSNGAAHVVSDLNSGNANTGNGPVNGYNAAQISQTDANSYLKQLDGGASHVGSGYLAGFLNGSSAETKITNTTSFVTQYGYYYDTPGNGSSTNQITPLTIKTFQNGDTVLYANTPIPPSVLLMGSGLLGLVGIRRKKVA